MKISIQQLYKLIELYSKIYSGAKPDGGLVNNLANLFEYEVYVPIDYMQMFAGLIQ